MHLNSPYVWKTWALNTASWRVSVDQSKLRLFIPHIHRIFFPSFRHLDTHALVLMGKRNRDTCSPAHPGEWAACHSARQTGLHLVVRLEMQRTSVKKNPAILVFLFLLDFIKDFYNHRYVCSTQSTFHCSSHSLHHAPTPLFLLRPFSLLRSKVI